MDVGNILVKVPFNDLKKKKLRENLSGITLKCKFNATCEHPYIHIQYNLEFEGR